MASGMRLRRRDGRPILLSLIYALRIFCSPRKQTKLALEPTTKASLTGLSLLASHTATQLPCWNSFQFSVFLMSALSNPWRRSSSACRRTASKTMFPVVARGQCTALVFLEFGRRALILLTSCSVTASLA